MAESQIFQKSFKTLQSFIQTDVENFTLELYSKGLVDKGVRDEVLCLSSPAKAATKLLCAVETKITLNSNDLDEFIGALETHPPWKELGESLRRDLFLANSTQVRPQLESGGNAHDARPKGPPLFPRSLKSQPPTQAAHDPAVVSLYNAQSPVYPINISAQTLVISSPADVVRTLTGSVDFLRSQDSSTQPEDDTLKSTLQPSTLQSDGVRPDDSFSAEKYPPAVSEAEDYSSPSGCTLATPSFPSLTPSQSSDTSICSFTEEDIITMKTSINELVSKMERMRITLKKSEKKRQLLKKEKARDSEMFESGMAEANAQNKELRKELESSQMQTQRAEEDAADMKERLLKGDQQRLHLLDQLKDNYVKMNENQERCKVLEAQLKEANSSLNFCDAYQKSEAKVQELETENQRLKEEVKDYTGRIEVLETEIEVLVSTELFTDDQLLSCDTLESL